MINISISEVRTAQVLNEFGFGVANAQAGVIVLRCSLLVVIALGLANLDEWKLLGIIRNERVRLTKLEKLH